MDMDIIVQRCSKPVVKVVSPTNLPGSWRTIAVGLLLVALVIEFASTMRLTRREYLWVEQNAAGCSHNMTFPAVRRNF